MSDKLSSIWDWTREIIETTRIHHYIALGMVSLWIVLMKGENIMVLHACVITTLFFVLLICFIWSCVGITKLVKTMRIKGVKATIKSKMDELDKFIGDVKDDISNDDLTMTTAGDESLRRMAKLQKDQHVAKLHKFEAQKSQLANQLSTLK